VNEWAVPGRQATPDERRVMTLYRLHTAYPKWMDGADYLESKEFREIVGQAEALYKIKLHDHKWRVNCHSLFRRLDTLEDKVTNRTRKTLHASHQS
jgi:hypothetical protein